MRVTIDKEKLYTKIAKFNYLLGYKLGALFQSYLFEEKREYPRTTIRKHGKGITGKIATSPRDVVDSGKLVKSFIWKNLRLGNRLNNNYLWTANHASLVYFGWVSATGQQIPPYPWIKKALHSLDWDKFLTETWRETL